jgi:hypothetical protein
MNGRRLVVLLFDRAIRVRQFQRKFLLYPRAVDLFIHRGATRCGVAAQKKPEVCFLKSIDDCSGMIIHACPR